MAERGRLLDLGFTSERLSEGLFLSESTVRNHLADIFKKLGVHSQEELLDLFRGARVE